ncbi:MAG: NUDIX domain-containing protein [bacterium]|nr:NUDIX domain-containing protein [bacterium]
MKIAAGLLMYRMKNGQPEVFLVHPGGPFFKNKDYGVWSLPKGLADEGEDLLDAAKREFEEETSFKVQAKKFIELSPVEKPGKVVHVWAFEGDCDPPNVKSNTCMAEWPPRTGKQIEIPEVDRGDFFTLDEAEKKLYPYLVPVIGKFRKVVVI